MADKSSVKMPEFLREPLEAAQARLVEFEEEAQRVFKDLVERSKESSKDVAGLVQRLSKQDWTMDELKVRVGKLRVQGRESAHELRDRAETFRSEAVERLSDLQMKAVAFLGVATRDQVEALSHELEKLARLIEHQVQPHKARRPKRAGKRGAEV